MLFLIIWFVFEDVQGVVRPETPWLRKQHTSGTLRCARQAAQPRDFFFPAPLRFGFAFAGSIVIAGLSTYHGSRWITGLSRSAQRRESAHDAGAAEKRFMKL